MNYCKHLKKRKKKPYCSLLKKEITLSQCQECVNKEYRVPVKGKMVKSNKNQIRKSPVKSKKRITVSKETYNAVIQRDNYCCRLCGSTDWIQCHHILYRSERKDLINDTNNCIMLCENCHRTVHSNKKKWQPILIEMNNKNC